VRDYKGCGWGLSGPVLTRIPLLSTSDEPRLWKVLETYTVFVGIRTKDTRNMLTGELTNVCSNDWRHISSFFTRLNNILPFSEFIFLYVCLRHRSGLGRETNKAKGLCLQMTINPRTYMQDPEQFTTSYPRSIRSRSPRLSGCKSCRHRNRHICM
jgi:hypothetical protein